MSDEHFELEPHVAEPDEEALSGDAGRQLITRVITQELGEEVARRFATVWQRLDEWDQGRDLSQGLRERKKRETRQRISDAATTMFLARGYENVKVSEIADAVGVSEKTIYNYFPTKESLVYDQADEQLLRLASAVRNRPAGTSPTTAFVTAVKADAEQFNAAASDTALGFLRAFGDMIRETPALRAAWGDHRHQMVDALTAILADEAGVDPRDPEPISAARALVSLLELFYDSLMRHLADGVPVTEMRAAIEADLDRGARLLDTGLWSFHLMVEGRKTKDQLRDAAVSAEQARQQVLRALRDAKAAWLQIREEAREAQRQHRDAQRQHLEEAREAQHTHREEVREAQHTHREEAREAQHTHREEAREAQRKHREEVREAQHTHREQARLRGRGRS